VRWRNHYDIHATAGHDRAVDQTIQAVTVTDGQLVIEFVSIRNYAMVSAISVHSSAT
jgi:hypothetical protein